MKKAKKAPGRFRKKPVLVDAFQFDGSAESIVALIEWGGGLIAYLEASEQLQIQTPAGRVYARQGDWVVKGPRPRGRPRAQEDFYPCAAETFEQTYEVADS